jgi:isoleucyl-tRNA synthetase
MLALDRWAVDRTRCCNASWKSTTANTVSGTCTPRCTTSAQELGGFYLDIIKDRQYTTGANSVARRSCQTALYHISEALVRWIAPILAFTADEIWQYLPGERNESVMLNGWYEGLSELPEGTELDRAYWDA